MAEKPLDKTPEEWQAWLDKFPDDPEGCIACGAMAGCCSEYPNCPGNPKWSPAVSANEQQP